MNNSVVKHNHNITIASAGLGAETLQQLEEEVFKGDCIIRTFNELCAVQTEAAKCSDHANAARAVSNRFLYALDMCINHLKWETVHLFQFAFKTGLTSFLICQIRKMPQIIASKILF